MTLDYWVSEQFGLLIVIYYDIVMYKNSFISKYAVVLYSSRNYYKLTAQKKWTTCNVQVTVASPYSLGSSLPCRDNSRQLPKWHTRRHTSRQNIERSIGVLVSRFLCLDKTGGTLCYFPWKVCKIVVAVASLHNVCIVRGTWGRAGWEQCGGTSER